MSVSSNTAYTFMKGQDENDVVIMNEGLVRLVCREIQPTTLLDQDDILNIARLAVVRAYRLFDEDRKVPWTTYCRAAIRTEVFRHLRYEKAQKRAGASQNASLSTTLWDDAKCGDPLNWDFSQYNDSLLGIEQDPEKTAVMKDTCCVILDIIKRKMSEKEYRIALMIMDGYTQLEIAQELGISQANVCQCYDKIKRLVNWFLRAEGHESIINSPWR